MYGDVGCIMAADELAKYISGSSHARAGGRMLFRCGSNGWRTGYRRDELLVGAYVWWNWLVGDSIDIQLGELPSCPIGKLGNGLSPSLNAPAEAPG